MRRGDWKTMWEDVVWGRADTVGEQFLQDILTGQLETGTKERNNFLALLGGTNGSRFGRLRSKSIPFERILAELLASPHIARVLEPSHHVKGGRRREGPPNNIRKSQKKKTFPGTFELFH